MLCKKRSGAWGPGTHLQAAPRVLAHCETLLSHPVLPWGDKQWQVTCWECWLSVSQEAARWWNPTLLTEKGQ